MAGCAYRRRFNFPGRARRRGSFAIRACLLGANRRWAPAWVRSALSWPSAASQQPAALVAMGVVGGFVGFSAGCRLGNPSTSPPESPVERCARSAPRVTPIGSASIPSTSVDSRRVSQVHAADTEALASRPGSLQVLHCIRCRPAAACSFAPRFPELPSPCYITSTSATFFPALPGLRRLGRRRRRRWRLWRRGRSNPPPC